MLTENLNAFFNTEEFAVEAMIQGIVVKGILESADVTIHQVHACKFIFTCPAAISNPRLGDEISIADQIYRVLEIKPDGTGLVSLTLESLA